MTRDVGLECFTQGCIDALQFTENEGDDRPLDPECLLNLEADCRSFWHRFGCFIEAEPDGPRIEQAGMDFWYTRNGHGCGFWDGDWPRYGDMLTEAAKHYGEFNPEFTAEE